MPRRPHVHSYRVTIAPSALSVPVRLQEGRGLPLVRLTCEDCGATRFWGWVPPTWITATERLWHRLSAEAV